jgi:uncharacterized protein DUF3179
MPGVTEVAAFMRCGLFLATMSLVAGACATTSGVQVGETVDVAAQLPAGPSALDTRTSVLFPPPLIEPSEIVAGGPPPDGIPSLDNPRFVAVADSLDVLDRVEPVIAVEVNGDARAYPARIMIWHEIVNDTVGGVPVAITYCPLCNSAIAFVRRVRGVETTFGTSGALYASSLVMYDRATESLWTHFDGRAVIGMLTGDQLEVIAAPLMSWSTFVERYPDGLVLDETRTGFDRAYGTNPYAGYDNPSTEPALFTGFLDTREVAKERIAGIQINGDARAYRLSTISSADGVAATSDSVGGVSVVILWEEGQVSALDTAVIVQGKEIGTVGIFRSDVDGRQLNFSVRGGKIVDDETASTWSVAGFATTGELAGTQLERVTHFDTFWFAWSTFRPSTTVFETTP